MLKITCHNDNIQERKYAIDILFHTLLGIPNDAYEIALEDDVTSYIIEFRDSKVIVEDHFFRHFSDPLSYLSINNIPSEGK